MQTSRQLNRSGSAQQPPVNDDNGNNDNCNSNNIGNALDAQVHGLADEEEHDGDEQKMMTNNII